jgi:hypothetical protein
MGVNEMSPERLDRGDRFETPLLGSPLRSTLEGGLIAEGDRRRHPPGSNHGLGVHPGLCGRPLEPAG